MKITEQELLSLFPEFNWIQDEDLKKKSICVWLRACEHSDWDKLTDIPFSGGFTSEPDNLVYHVRLTTDYSYEVAQKSNELQEYKVDLDLIVAGALLHDVCKVVEYSKAGGKSDWGKEVTHGIYGVCLAQQEELPLEIIHIIASHTEKLGMPNKTLESIIIHNCDNIAAAGSYLISRNKVKSNGKWIDL